MTHRAESDGACMFEPRPPAARRTRASTARGACASSPKPRLPGLQLHAMVTNGPTRGRGLEPFDWHQFRGQGIPHSGMPESFAHGRFEHMGPQVLPRLQASCTAGRAGSQ